MDSTIRVISPGRIGDRWVKSSEELLTIPIVAEVEGWAIESPHFDYQILFWTPLWGALYRLREDRKWSLIKEFDLADDLKDVVARSRSSSPIPISK